MKNTIISILLYVFFLRSTPDIKTYLTLHTKIKIKRYLYYFSVFITSVLGNFSFEYKPIVNVYNVHPSF